MNMETKKSLTAPYAKWECRNTMKPEKFKRCREALGLDTLEMAQTLGVARSTVYRWETGESRIPIATGQLVEQMVKSKRKGAA